MFKISKKQILTFSLLAVFFLTFSFSSALAADSVDTTTTDTVDVALFADNDMTKTLCNVLNLVTGGIGKTFAAFAIIALGVGFFGGKVSYANMIGVTLGIAAMFGAPAIIKIMTGDSTNICGE